MICPACGAKNREGARFCKSCGLDLAAVPAPATQENVAAADQAAPAAEPAPEPGEAEDKDSAEDLADVQPEQEPAPEPGPEGEEGIDQPEVDTPAGSPEKEPAGGDRPGEEEAEAPDGARGQAPDGARGQAPDGARGQAPEPAAAGPDEGAPEADEDDQFFWREEAQALAPAQPGTVVAGRYELVEALDVQAEEILYLAEDLFRCWQCGFEGNAPKDAFCSQCGASLEPRPEVRLLQVASAEAEPTVSAGLEVGARLEDEGRNFWVLTERPEEPAEPAARDVRLIVGQRSDAGKVRELDEDSLLTMTVGPNYEGRTAPMLGLYAVADGMGGHEGGEVASKLALQVLAEQALRTIILPELAGELILDEEMLVRLRRAIVAANDAVYLARQKRGNDMGTTLTTVVVRNTQLLLGHVGDCRAFRWNAGGLEQLTTDHSVVASMVANGQAAPEEIYTHPHRSVIYRSVGDKPSVEVDTASLPLAIGDRIVVCSDGLWEMVRNEGITDVLMQEADPQAACDLLVKHANVAGGEDNISVVVIQVAAM